MLLLWYGSVWKWEINLPEKCIILMGTNYSMIKHQFFGYPIFSETHHFHNSWCRFPNMLMIICFSRFLSSVFGNGLLPETPSFEGWPPLDQHFSWCFDLPKILRFCVVTRGILQASFHSFSGDTVEGASWRIFVPQHLQQPWFLFHLAGAVVLMLQPSSKASDARGWHVVPRHW